MTLSVTCQAKTNKQKKQVQTQAKDSKGLGFISKETDFASFRNGQEIARAARSGKTGAGPQAEAWSSGPQKKKQVSKQNLMFQVSIGKKASCSAN